MARVYTVEQVTNYIKRMISSDYALGRIQIAGELSNVKYHSTGLYFTLKDGKSAMPGIMYPSDQRTGLKERVQTGQKVVVTGHIDVYVRDGKYQIYASQIQPEGTGNQHEQLERLKAKLNEEGLFDFDHKKPIPAYATKIGIVTAKDGDAIKDIVTTVRSRNPYVQLYLYPSKVQGLDAPRDIISGIKVLDQMGLDTIIIGRGGGSSENLDAFNDEGVAYAIYHANTPIISGTGHTANMSIADYVADLHVITPTDAGEKATFASEPYIQSLEEKEQQLKHLLTVKCNHLKALIENKELRLTNVSPESKLQHQNERINQARLVLNQLMEQKIEASEQAVIVKQEKMDALVEQLFQKRLHQLEVITAKLDGLSPTAKLIHGFGYVQKNGVAVQNIQDLMEGDLVRITMKDGSKQATILGDAE